MLNPLASTALSKLTIHSADNQVCSKIVKQAAVIECQLSNERWKIFWTLLLTIVLMVVPWLCFNMPDPLPPGTDNHAMESRVFVHGAGVIGSRAIGLGLFIAAVIRYIFCNDYYDHLRDTYKQMYRNYAEKL